MSRTREGRLCLIPVKRTCLIPQALCCSQNAGASHVNHEVTTRMKELVHQIQAEDDYEKFSALVQELNDVLNRGQQRIEPESSTAAS
jgi:hypothetical protein